MHGGQEFIAIAQVVLAELASSVAKGFEQICNGWIFRLKADGSARHSDFGQARPKRVLTGNERCASCGAALLAVEIRKSNAFVSNAIDVGGAITHHATAEIADIPGADVVAPQNEDIRFGCRHFCSFLLVVCKD